MSLSGGRGKSKAVDTQKIKFLSRTKTYQGKVFRDFTAMIMHNGTPLLVTITKQENVDMIYPVGTSTGEQAKEKKTGEPLYVIYGRVTELTPRTGGGYKGGV